MEKEIKKVKLIYSGELLIFAIIFIVLGFLDFLAVIKLSSRFQLIFKIVTLVGATFITGDFIWILLSPKRKAKNSLLDKIMLLLLAVYLYVFDILGFVLEPGYGYYQVGVSIAFIYFGCAYLFQAIYHYYHPIPSVIEMIEEIQKEEEAKQAEPPSNENNENDEEK